LKGGVYEEFSDKKIDCGSWANHETLLSNGVPSSQSLSWSLNQWKHIESSLYPNWCNLL
jgi:hypothetical protein